jgi:hypothetical protein
MTRTLAYTLSACVLLAGGTATIRGALAQDRTQQPGQPTQARVWIQNQGEKEAVPVSIQNVAPDSLLQVQVTGDPLVRIGSGSVVEARIARQSWEYRTLTVTAGQDPVAVLNSAGVDGWEATGLTVPATGGTIVFMKRPK